MSLRKIIGKLFVFIVLELGALAGVPMSPEQIENLMNVMNRTKVVHVMRTESSGDGDQSGSSAVGP